MSIKWAWCRAFDLTAAAQRELGRRLRSSAASLLESCSERQNHHRGEWLFGEFVGNGFGDNSATLFTHIRNTRSDIDATWVIDSTSKYAVDAAAVGPTIGYKSVEAHRRARRAKVLVISHGIHDIPDFSLSHTDRSFRVRLGHGLTALKKAKPPPGRTLSDLARLYDLVPVASGFERDLKIQWGIPREKIVVTGLPRFDRLARAARSSPRGGLKRILYVPTWRDWDPRNTAAFAKSQTVQNIVALLEHPVLRQALKAHNVELVLNCHPLMANAKQVLQQALEPELMRFAESNEGLHLLLASSDALITDYSSLTWDMLYLNRPVFFYTFDRVQYENHRGSYVDLERDLPGVSAQSPGSMAELLAEALAEPLIVPVDGAAARWASTIFRFRDDKNCMRVLAAIEERIVDRHGPYN